MLTDTNGLLVAAVVHEADIQDRDGAPLVLATVRYLYPWLRHVFADGAYSGPKLDAALDKIGRWTIESSSAPTPPADLSSCRGAGWSSVLRLAQPHRRLAKDFETSLQSALLAIPCQRQTLIRRLGRVHPPPRL